MKKFINQLRQKGLDKGLLPIDILFTSIESGNENKISEYERDFLAKESIKMERYSYEGFTLKLSKKCISKLINPDKILD